MLTSICLLLFALVTTTVSYGNSLHPWEVYTLSFTARNSYANPYADIPVQGDGDLLRVTFTETGGDAEGTAITLKGAWNRGMKWNAHDAAHAAAPWPYITT